MSKTVKEPEHNLKAGYIKICRSITSHWLYEPKRKRTKLEAWFDLLLRANHSAVSEIVGHDKIEVKRGQILTSQERLSSDWHWDRSSVRSFLNSLHNDRNIAITTTSKYTMITICKYDAYQSISPTSQQHFNQQNNSKSTHSINDKTFKEDKYILSNDSIVGLDKPTPTKPVTFEEKCRMFIDKFNELKKSKYQVTDTVRVKLKARLKDYKASDIIHALKVALKDEHHIENNFVYVTPEFILRGNIIERYLNAKEKEVVLPDPAKTLPASINHNDRA